MNATLTLDDDVAALLERAREERGWSLEELGNELLRRTLRQLGAPSRRPEAVPRAAQLPDVSPLEARIDQLYEEIRDLVVRSAENPSLETEIQRKREKLRALQAEEAAGRRTAAPEAERGISPPRTGRKTARLVKILPPVLEPWRDVIERRDPPEAQGRHGYRHEALYRLADHLENERQNVARREESLDQLTAEAQEMGLYD